jgi:hypothetical protein
VLLVRKALRATWGIRATLEAKAHKVFREKQVLLVLSVQLVLLESTGVALGLVTLTMLTMTLFTTTTHLGLHQATQRKVKRLR